MLKWSSVGFIILQVLLFTVILILYLFAPGGWTFLPFLDQQSDEMWLLMIVVYFCCLVATANYIFVLILYTRKLWRNKRSSSRNGGTGGRSSSLTNMQISHPIPHHHQSVAIAPGSSSGNNSSTLNTTTSTATTPLNYYGQGQIHQHRGSGRTPMKGMNYSQHHGPESPGIYESLDANSVSGHHHFYPANFYSGYKIVFLLYE